MLLDEAPIEHLQPALCVATLRHGFDEALKHAQIFVAGAFLAVGIVPNARTVGVNAANGIDVTALDRIEKSGRKFANVVVLHFSSPRAWTRSNRMTDSPL